MNKPIPKALWIDRCTARMGEHGTGISPAEAVEHAEDLWGNVAQEFSPEVAADMAVGSIEALEHLFFTSRPDPLRLPPASP